jgi:hypothetical protein
MQVASAIDKRPNWALRRPLLQTNDEAESHSAQSHTLNESGRQDHVAHDITFGFGLASDAFQRAAADATYAKTCAYGSETCTNNGTCLCNGHTFFEENAEKGHRNEG